MKLGSYDLAKLRNFKDLNTDIFKNNFSGKVYVWSDFHLNDPEIIYVSGRKYWTTNSLGVSLPDIDSEKEYIIKELKELEDNSIFINLGDVGRLESIKDEDSIKEVNSILKNKNIYNILLLGNHDYLKNNKYYEILAGHECEFYKNLGFNKIIRNPFILKDNNEIAYLFSHEPVASEVIREINKNIKGKGLLDIKNIHGHWHSFEAIGDNRVSTCLDIINKPINIEIKSEEPIFKETCITEDKFFLKDPWI